MALLGDYQPTLDPTRLLMLRDAHPDFGLQPLQQVIGRLVGELL